MYSASNQSRSPTTPRLFLLSCPNRSRRCIQCRCSIASTKSAVRLAFHCCRRAVQRASCLRADQAKNQQLQKQLCKQENENFLLNQRIIREQERMQELCRQKATLQAEAEISHERQINVERSLQSGASTAAASTPRTLLGSPRSCTSSYVRVPPRPLLSTADLLPPSLVAHPLVEDPRLRGASEAVAEAQSSCCL